MSSSPPALDVVLDPPNVLASSPVWLQSEMWLQRNRKPQRLELQENNKPLTRQDLLDKNKRIVGGRIIQFHRDVTNEFLGTPSLQEGHICHYQESFKKMPNEAVISKKILLEGRRVDISQIIATEMKNVAESGKEFGAGTISAHPLVYPGSIMGFLIASRIRIPNVVPFVIKTKVNDTYMESSVCDILFRFSV
ncbi:hypothetical protein RYX36_012554 [Vicia faba]